jgi:hypothetical protein
VGLGDLSPRNLDQTTGTDVEKNLRLGREPAQMPGQALLATDGLIEVKRGQSSLEPLEVGLPEERTLDARGRHLKTVGLDDGIGAVEALAQGLGHFLAVVESDPRRVIKEDPQDGAPAAARKLHAVETEAIGPPGEKLAGQARHELLYLLTPAARQPNTILGNLLSNIRSGRLATHSLETRLLGWIVRTQPAPSAGPGPGPHASFEVVPPE